MKFTLKIKLGNDAMRQREDVAQALRVVADNLTTAYEPQDGTIRDVNGNTVGTWAFTKS